MVYRVVVGGGGFRRKERTASMQSDTLQNGTTSCSGRQCRPWVGIIIPFLPWCLLSVPYKKSPDSQPGQDNGLCDPVAIFNYRALNVQATNVHRRNPPPLLLLLLLKFLLSFLSPPLMSIQMYINLNL